MPAISICVPAYKRVGMLKRLLDSIIIQTYTDFEVIVTDDSPDNAVELLCEQYGNLLPLRYYKNATPLGTPENWNEAIRFAKGEWIKIMHDDDWLSNADSLSKFYQLAVASPGTDFIFSGSSIYEHDQFKSGFTVNSFQVRLLRTDPRNLFHKNFIGPPSAILHRNHQHIQYDNRMKWLVDVDFYMRFLQDYPNFQFTRERLVNVGLSEGQVTSQVFYDKKVVIPETLLLLQKTGEDIFKNIWNYDFAWRIMRNYGITSEEEMRTLTPASVTTPLASVFPSILKAQSHIPKKVLMVGLFSKFFMFINYINFRFTHRVKRIRN
jgi:glycosyltransferase involved in cell wall biosynthesis